MSYAGEIELKWNEALSMGQPEIDADHKRFIGVVNILNEAILVMPQSEIIVLLVEELVKITEDHFSREDAILERTGYPLATRHADEHAALLEYIIEACDTIRYSTYDEPKMLGSAVKIKVALLNHLMKHDMDFKPHLIGRNS